MSENAILIFLKKKYLFTFQALVRIPPGLDPKISFSFLREPLCKWDVRSQFGSWATFKNMPKVSTFFIQKLDEFMKRDTVLPNGICFHIPIKNERQLNIKLVRKWNENNPNDQIILPPLSPAEMVLLFPVAVQFQIAFPLTLEFIFFATIFFSIML